MGQVLEKIPMDDIKEKLGQVKEKISDLDIPEKIKNFDPLKMCRPDYINSEDRAQIFALQTDEQEAELIPEDAPALEERLRAKAKPKPKVHVPIMQFHDLDDDTQNILDKLNETYGKPKEHMDFNYDDWEKFDPEEADFYDYTPENKAEQDDFDIVDPDDLEKVQIYQGEINPETKKRDGYGIEATKEGVKIGMWREGEFSGWGRESRRNGDVLQGKFEGGMLNGRGKYTNAKDETYVGEFKDNKKNGPGTVNTKKIIYNGEFLNDKMHGEGEILFKNTGNSYKGQFTNGEITGEGKCTWKNGDVYEGKMVNGKRSGYGKYYTNDSRKSVYEGNYEDGRKSGQGRIIYNNGSKIYSGNFEKGKAVGSGNLNKFGKDIKVDINNGKVTKSVVQK